MYTTLFSAPLGLGLACAAWGVGLAYQRLRYRVLDAEDASQLARARAGEPSQGWLASVRRQAPRGMVSAATLGALQELGLIEPELAERASKAAQGYNPSVVRSLVPWLPLCALAVAAVRAQPLVGGAHALNAPAALVYTLSFALVGMADARFRIVPIPFLVPLAASALVAFPWVSPLSMAVSMGVFAGVLWAASKAFEGTFMRPGVCGTGDVLIMAVIFATLVATPTAAVMGTFLGAFVAGCAALMLHYSRGRKLTLGGFTMLRVPLGPAAALAAIACVAVV